MPFTVVPPYAALLGLLYVILSVRVIRYRRGHRISLGHANDPKLERLVRAHGNFAEYVPISLLLLCLVEAERWSPYLLHALCLSLCAGRLAHAQAIPSMDFRWRVVGMSLTFGTIVGASLLLCLR